MSNKCVHKSSIGEKLQRATAIAEALCRYIDRLRRRRGQWRDRQMFQSSESLSQDVRVRSRPQKVSVNDVRWLVSLRRLCALLVRLRSDGRL